MKDWCYFFRCETLAAEVNASLMKEYIDLGEGGIAQRQLLPLSLSCLGFDSQCSQKFWCCQDSSMALLRVGGQRLNNFDWANLILKKKHESRHQKALEVRTQHDDEKFDWLHSQCWFIVGFLIFFCSTSLPLASTRWVQSTLLGHWPLF